ncbi:serine/threonine-protein kinase/endoribonuclease IRE1-like [Tasmannia lanceolata]|uniref:serine/threonine-protein kinase/endoribonuclease IRE1-like n=1 Tax=Tasmannia lanceolata TaxID=3420 RepID=UPI004062F26A
MTPKSDKRGKKSKPNSKKSKMQSSVDVPGIPSADVHNQIVEYDDPIDVGAFSDAQIGVNTSEALTGAGSNRKKIGELILSNRVIPPEEYGILEGVYDGMNVAVKRIPHERIGTVNKEADIHRDTHLNENIVMYYGMETDDKFCYIILERWTCCLYDLITHFSNVGTPRLEFVNGIPQDLKLFNGRLPSSQLTKLMRRL